ncbi:YifB family Mg chelatase-like AAA ATPase [Alteromonas halophila]|uniref:Magnesium chelatase n=1 Tax=Alteromonas halophila TaxID=516698 RepID=A0A918JN93_9ALTE|nr:YifB family Mg chelatase-like AAA ATPase [Alteromonas halophila]GGW91306.1 magnesium chelatase [Alteromonas halophila]
MGLALVSTFAGQGVNALPVTAEVHLANGLPAFQLVGMAETSVKEARERVRSALLTCGFDFPAKRITVNLAPADIAKAGGRFDLPIAIGILAAAGYLSQEQLDNCYLIGELSLNGELKPVQGVIPALIASAENNRALIYPGDNDIEATLVTQATRLPAFDLLAVVHHLSGELALRQSPEMPADAAPPALPGWDDIIGQQQAKRALQVAAAGAHNLLMLGPQGTGKSLLASRLASLLPPLTKQQALEVASILSIRGEPVSPARFLQRPFRSPHHTCSAVALTGGGSIPMPGEVSMAHHGILFLDELPEFGRRSLDVLREPLETGDVHIARASGQATFPARFQLIAAMNPSPTGDIDDNRLTPQQQLNYLNRLSGPLLDRIDIQVEVPRQPDYLLCSPDPSQPDSMLTARDAVMEAVTQQHARQGKANAHLAPSELEKVCYLDAADLSFLQHAASKLKLSMRVFHRTLKVSRTLADLESAQRVRREHIAEALGYRALDRLIHQLSAT